MQGELARKSFAQPSMAAVAPVFALVLRKDDPGGSLRAGCMEKKVQAGGSLNSVVPSLADTVSVAGFENTLKKERSSWTAARTAASSATGTDRQ